jgi:hypothetical protein
MNMERLRLLKKREKDSGQILKFFYFLPVALKVD